MEELRAFLSRWLSDFPLDSRAEDAEYHRLIAFTFPTAEFGELALIGKVILWGFLYDDRFDTDRLGSDVTPARAEADKVAQVLLGGAVPAGDVWLGSLADLRGQAAAILPPDLLRRLTADILSFVQSIATEVEMRVRGEMPDMDEYLRLRMETFAWHVLVDLAEAAGRRVVPAVVRRSSAYRSLVEASGRVMCWTNDLHSLRKELLSGETHNMVLVLQRQRGGTLEDATETLHKMMGAELERFAECETALARLTEEHHLTAAEKSTTERFTQNLRYLMSGQNAWCASTTRYRIPDSAFLSPAS